MMVNCCDIRPHHRLFEDEKYFNKFSFLFSSFFVFTENTNGCKWLVRNNAEVRAQKDCSSSLNTTTPQRCFETHLNVQVHIVVPKWKTTGFK